MNYSKYIALILIFIMYLPAFSADNNKNVHKNKPSLECFKEVSNNIPENGLQIVNTFPEKNWWEDFNDPILAKHILKAIENNHDLKIAALTIEEARALVRESLGHEMPTLSINPAYTRQKNSKNLTTPTISQFQGALPRLFSPGSSVNIFSVPLNASYEADFWLKNRKITKAKEKQLDSLKHTYNSAIVLISTEVASAYFNLLKADKLIQLQQQEISLRKDQYNILKAQYDAGLIAYSGVLEAKEAVAQSESVLPEYQLQQTLFLHQLAVLMGDSTSNVDNIERTSIDNLKLPLSLNAGLPSELVLRRPDILSVEAELQKAKIEVSLARKAFFPSIVLSGNFGYSSTKLSNLFNWDSILTAFTASLAETIFSGGSRKAKLKASKFRYEQFLQKYYQTVLTAFQDVEDSLASYKYHYKQNNDNIERLSLVQDNISITDSKYDQGLITYLDVIKYKQKLLLREKELTNSTTNCLIDTLALYKALGGGF